MRELSKVEQDERAAIELVSEIAGEKGPFQLQGCFAGLKPHASTLPHGNHHVIQHPQPSVNTDAIG